jgi:hypothetical protein
LYSIIVAQGVVVPGHGTMMQYRRFPVRLQGLQSHSNVEITTSTMHIAKQRLVNQRLVGQPFGGPEAAVGWLGAVQAQDYNGAKWALALRTRGVDSATIDRAFNAGAFLRTHVMRPTWHFVAAEDLRWLLALTRARVHAANAHMYRRLELTGQVCRRANALIAAALEGRYATRPELATILEAMASRHAGSGSRIL